VLTVDENTNPGWVATLGGHRLAGVTVDGWQQGYVVPAGAQPATVELAFAPDRWMRWGMLGGALAVLALLLGAALPGRRIRQLSRPAGGPRLVVAVASVAALSLVGGLAGLVVAAAAAGSWLVARRSGRARALLPWAAGALLVAAGLRLAIDPWGTAAYAAGARLTQWLCLGALGLAFAAAQLPGWEPDGGPDGSADVRGTGS
jgi:arabinofuranan 3-O-arabinosyltransferase